MKSKNNQLNLNKIEENHRVQKLKEAQKSKLELAEKLISFGSQIDETAIEKSNSHSPIKHIKPVVNEELKERDDKAKNLIQKLNQDRKEREKRAQLLQETLDRKLKEDFLLNLMRQKELEEKIKEDKKQKIEERLKIFEQKQKERELFFQKDREASKEKKEVPLFKKIIGNFDKQNLVELERRKKLLNERREFHKSINENDLKEHAEKYEHDIKVKLLQKKEEQLIGNSQQLLLQQHQHYYKSKFHSLIKDREEEVKQREIKEKEDKKSLKEKQNQYSQVVKELFFPKINKEKEYLSRELIKDVLMRGIQAEEYKEDLIAQPYKFIIKKKFKANLKKDLINLNSNHKEITQSPDHSDNDIQNRGVDNPNKNLDEDGEFNNSLKKLNHEIDNDQSHHHINYPSRHNINKKNSQSLKGAKVPSSELIETNSDRKLNKYLKANDKDENLIKYKAHDIMIKSPELRYAQANEQKIENRLSMRNSIKNSSNNLKSKISKKAEEKQIQEESPPKFEYPNYIEEIRRKRIEQEKQGVMPKIKWEKSLNDNKLSYKDKVDNILIDAKRLEDRAQRKEELVRKSGMSNNDDDIDDIYMESIKAKLAVLQQWKET